MENLVFNYQTIVVYVISYCIGSIPFGYLIYKFKSKDDIRKFGSGNIGATNVKRLLGSKLGAITLLLDFCKTYFTCFIILRIYGTEIASISGLLTIIGHIFPLWLRFRGGKGVASFIGFLCLVSWPLSLTFVLIWIIFVKIFKYSGAGAIFSIIFNLISFKLLLLIQFSYQMLLWIPGTPFQYNITLILSLLILFKHYSNFVNFFKK